VSLTDAAAARVKEIMANADEAYVGVRVGVKNAGCAGMEYTMDYATEKGAIDEVVEDQGVTIFIDPAAVLFLLGSTVDYRIDKLSAKFIFNNPNQTDACGCGESVTIVPARLETEEPLN
jgi:iron-sulfur cluster assembly protein